MSYVVQLYSIGHVNMVNKCVYLYLCIEIQYCVKVLDSLRKLCSNDLHVAVKLRYYSMSVKECHLSHFKTSPKIIPVFAATVQYTHVFPFFDSPNAPPRTLNPHFVDV